MIDVPRGSPEAERLWRALVWDDLLAAPEWPRFRAGQLQESRVFRGGRGIWVDLDQTRDIAENGVAVAVKHSRQHYDDQLDDRGLVYDYPKTLHTGRDKNEVQAVKNAMTLGLPMFVVIDHGELREVRRSWVSGYDDASSQFLFVFSDQPSAMKVTLDQPFEVHEPKRRNPDLILRLERNPQFRFEVFRRFQGRCAVSDLGVTKMLEAAHVVPVAKGGADDPRNGLLLSASHHRAFDRQLWSINPATLAIETKPGGPSLEKMKFTRTSVTHLAESGSLPHRDALEVNYELFRKAAGF